jgi:hypothetical protein
MSIVRPYSHVEGYHFRGIQCNVSNHLHDYTVSQPRRPHFHSHENLKSQMAWLRIEVLTVTSMKMAVFWVVVPCSLMEVPRMQITHFPDNGGSKHL